jgi:DNA (cytosine-5)-methyltransferase 1
MMWGGVSMAITCSFLPSIAEPVSVAMRGRNPNNPSERGKSNGKYKQRIEMNKGGVANTITSVQKDSMVAESRVKQVGNIYPDTDTFKNRTMGRVYSDEGLSPTFNCCGGGDREPKIVEDWQTIVGNKQLNPFRGSVEGTSPCITSACGAGGGMTPMLTDADLETTKTKEFIEQVRGHEEMRYRIRKLTPRECFRLMGVDDADIDKLMNASISNSQLYKCAGNSIVVDVLYHLFRKLYIDKGCEKDNFQQTLF